MPEENTTQPTNNSSSSNLGNSLSQFWRHATLRENPTSIPGLAGPLQSGVVKGLGGYFGGRLLADLLAEDKSKREKRLQRILGYGGLAAGAGSALPDLWANYRLQDHPAMKDSDMPWYANEFPYNDAASEDGKYSYIGYDYNNTQDNQANQNFQQKSSAVSDTGYDINFNSVPDNSDGAPQSISRRNLEDTIFKDTSLLPGQKSQLQTVVRQAESRAGGGGLVSTNDLVNAGLGYFAGSLAGKSAGKVLGGIGIMSPDKQSKLARLGGIGGLLRATGIWQN